MSLSEGVWCRRCKERIPLSEAGEHELSHDEDEPLVRTAGPHTSIDRNTPRRDGYHSGPKRVRDDDSDDIEA